MIVRNPGGERELARRRGSGKRRKSKPMMLAARCYAGCRRRSIPCGMAIAVATEISGSRRNDHAKPLRDRTGREMLGVLASTRLKPARKRKVLAMARA